MRKLLLITLVLFSKLVFPQNTNFILKKNFLRTIFFAGFLIEFEIRIENVNFIFTVTEVFTHSQLFNVVNI